MSIMEIPHPGMTRIERVIGLDGGRLAFGSGRRFGEFVHVGVARPVRAPAGGAECLGELLGELADVDGELSALL